MKRMNQDRSSQGITIKTERKGNSLNHSLSSPPSPLIYSTSNSGVGSNSSNSEADFLNLGLSKDFYDGTDGMSSSHSSPVPSPSCVQIDHDIFGSSAISLEESLSLLNGSSQKCNNNSTSDSAGASCQRLCLVCGDVASGFHYGVASCEACKAFFKRTIQGNIEYTCPASGECEINKRRRKACQACRFTKCLAMGMLKEGVRLDRVRGGRQKYRKLSDSSFTTTVPCKKPALDDNKLLEALQNCEPEGLQARQELINNSTMETNLKVMTILSDVIDRELVGAICWAKQIPGFTRLSFNDQMRLLKTSWSEILALLLAYRSLQPSGNGSSQISIVNLAFASNWTLDEQQAIDCGLEEIFVGIVQLMQRLDTLSLARDEYLALKALLLTNSDTQLENAMSVQSLRQHLLTTLYDCVVASCPTSAVVNHYSELLLCLPLLRQLGTDIRAFWCQVRQDGKVSMNKLFIEMLEPHFPPRPR